MLPLLRAAKYKYLYSTACRCVASQKKSPKLPSEVAFIVGCGRSGTTLLGDIMSAHHEVSYLFEPYYLWSAIDPRLDVLNLFNNIKSLLFLGNDFFLEEHRAAFAHCTERFSKDKHYRLLIEKTPLNSLRIGWLNKVYSGAKFVHIIRDGFDVCTSIERLATANSYKIAGKPNLNQWWGNNYSKWKALRRDGIAAGYFPQEVDLLDNHISKAAYEWLVNLKEIDRWRTTLGDQLCEITYNQLVTHPSETLKKLSNFLEVSVEAKWLEQSVAKINPIYRHNVTKLIIPPSMCEVFNQYQEKYGFLHRAKSDS